jgi:hypothetical protein
MTYEEYNYLAPRFNRHDRLIEAIPQNINRAGKLYRKLIKQIYESKYTN